MYADIDKRGLVSIFELRPFEKDTLIEALESFQIKLQDTIELIEGNDFIKQQREVTGKLASMLKKI